MKYTFTMGLIFAAMTVSAQTQYDGSHLIGSELNGTARFVGMGGAMSALGGDISTISTNPAGIGIFRSNDISVSFGTTDTRTSARMGSTTSNASNNRISFDQAGFVYSNKIGNNTTLRYINFGFNYHKDKNFNRVFRSAGVLDGLSMSWQMADILDEEGLTTQAGYDAILDAKNPYTQYTQYSILPLMAVRTGVAEFENGFGVLGWDARDYQFYSEERGGINSYEFNASFNIEDRLYLGVTLGVQDIDYRLYSSYSENVLDDDHAANGTFTLDNLYRLGGTGVDLKLGAIFRPVEDSPFRIGLAVHTPRWYNLHEDYTAELSSNILYFDEGYTENLDDYMTGSELAYEYDMFTPWKFNASMGTTVGKFLALDAEYEFQDYGTAKFRDVDGYEMSSSNLFSESMKQVHTFKIGAEARLAPGFSVRAGYNYRTAAFENDSFNYLPSFSTRPDFNNTKELSIFTAGLGYRGEHLYVDAAYKYANLKSDFYAFDDLDLKATQVNNDRHQVLVTLGYRF